MKSIDESLKKNRSDIKIESSLHFDNRFTSSPEILDFESSEQ